MKAFIIIVFSGILFVLSLRTYSRNTCSNIKSSDTVHVGEQVWMLKNLDVDTFRNGDVIKEAQSLDEWINACKEGIPAWCNYDNDTCNGKIFGKLYNWYAVNDSRGLAPEGFRIPAWADYRKLLDYVKGRTNSITERNNELLNNEHYPWANNKSGFSALRTGKRFGYIALWTPPDTLNRFIGLNVNANFWTSELCNYDTNYVWVFEINLDPPTDIYGYDKYFGFPVRCILDE